MTTYPRLKDIVLEHFVCDDLGIDEYNIHLVINTFLDADLELTTLKECLSYKDSYKVVQKKYFEGEDPIYKVFDLNNIHITRMAHEYSYSIVKINIFNGKYEIYMSNKASNTVFEDISSKLKEMIDLISSPSNLKNKLGINLEYKVVWEKGDYQWSRLHEWL